MYHLSKYYAFERKYHHQQLVQSSNKIVYQGYLQRPKIFLFVGQFIPRKNVLGLISAFERFSDTHKDWTLKLCGSGQQLEQIKKHPQIQIESFLQPTELGQLMKEARCVVLPSLEEHWGVVVHEAALSGCAMALSSSVGAADDLATTENAITFEPSDLEKLEQALHDFASWDNFRWQRAEDVSRDLATKFGPRIFANSVERVVSLVHEKLLRND